MINPKPEDTKYETIYENKLIKITQKYIYVPFLDERKLLLYFDWHKIGFPKISLKIRKDKIR